jgi:metal-responsive CopG/Arc/MetJ family transcriptional regulator
MPRKVKGKEECATFSVRLPIKLVEEIEYFASKENRTRNNMIEQMLWSSIDSMNDTHDLSLAYPNDK